MSGWWVDHIASVIIVNVIVVFGCSIGEFGCRGGGVSGIVELLVFFNGGFLLW